MRFTGKLHTWNDDRGFGFIRPADGGQDIFVHLSALPRPRPGPEEELTFEVALNPEGKKKAAHVRLLRREAAALEADKQVRATPRPGVDYLRRKRRATVVVRAGVIALLVVGGISAYAYHVLEERAKLAAMGFKPIAKADFRCDGRRHCSQMRSCKEAKFFLKNCPGVTMDGDGDGKPCEPDMCQWWWSD